MTYYEEIRIVGNRLSDLSEAIESWVVREYGGLWDLHVNWIRNAEVDAAGYATVEDPVTSEVGAIALLVERAPGRRADRYRVTAIGEKQAPEVLRGVCERQPSLSAWWQRCLTVAGGGISKQRCGGQSDVLKAGSS